MRTGDAEAASLARWLAFYAADAQEDCVSVVLRLLAIAFPAVVEDLKALDGWGAVVATLEGFYEGNLRVNVHKLEEARGEVNDTLRAVLELVLGAVVQCEAKDQFVKDILTMEDAEQAHLMTIIEKVLAQGVPDLRVDTVDEKIEQREEKQEEEPPGLRSPLYLSRNAALEGMKRENGVLTEENIYLARELEQATKRFHEVEGEKEKLVELVQGLKEQVDAKSLRKERAMHAQYDDRIQKLQLELDLTKAELNQKAALASKVPALSDEVDLLRPLAGKMKKVDSTIAKYKAKIDELARAKDSLRRLESTNAELVGNNLVLESELAKAATWQRKLKEAKQANTDVQFQVSQLETLLARERQERAESRAEFEAIQGALQESKALNDQLQEADHQLAIDATENDSSALTVAGGISEFNPELMQKLTRLEYENAELKRQIDSDTGARIDSLLDGIDDLSRLKTSFEKKYFATQQELQSTQSELKQTKKHFESTVAELQTRIQELSEWQLCLEEDVSAQALEKQSVKVSRQDRKLSEMREVSDAIASRNERLVEQSECLSRTKKHLEASLARQTECTAMLAEDTNAERLRLQQQKALELNQVCRQYEDQAAETISCMTMLVDAKSAEVEHLTTRLHEDKLTHDSELNKLEAARLSATKELERYQEQYSVSNADWGTKEKELHTRVNELESLCSQCKQQEQALKSTIKSQLQSNTRLVEKNKALKADAVENREMVARLASTTTQLESKVALLEKERSHFATEDERKRDVEDGMSSYSLQLSTQVSLVVAELEKVLKENKELLAKQVRCRCGHESPPPSGVSDSGQKAKNYYLTRIQQVEYDKQQVEHKRRELLLVNAKLIQEQKQLHVKNVSLSNQVHELEESVNHWRLHDERRRKNEGQRSLSLENEVSFGSPGARSAPTSGADPPRWQKSPSNESEKPNSEHRTNSKQTFSRESSVNALVLVPSGTKKALTPSMKAPAASVASRKRKLETDYTMTPDTAHPTRHAATSPDAKSTFTDATAFFSQPSAPLAQSNSKPSSEPHSKRRLSHFIARYLVPDKSTRETEKPSECKQQ
ncbi:Protein Hook 3 [Phytophthora pseudosyringae]|uniref:Protein Hook 3 n=1 Tax=Phytophthora pseudosyringae TaxID=221518 RepID=A0A8T1W132_9STRA|nr:Protein Hook 3 [Phytophthora pseudosyringae]